jgi:hypothetical protein
MSPSSPPLLRAPSAFFSAMPAASAAAAAASGNPTLCHHQAPKPPVAPPPLACALGSRRRSYSRRDVVSDKVSKALLIPRNACPAPAWCSPAQPCELGLGDKNNA